MTFRLIQGRKANGHEIYLMVICLSALYQSKVMTCRHFFTLTMRIFGLRENLRVRVCVYGGGEGI